MQIGVKTHSNIQFFITESTMRWLHSTVGLIYEKYSWRVMENPDLLKRNIPIDLPSMPVFVRPSTTALNKRKLWANLKKYIGSTPVREMSLSRDDLIDRFPLSYMIEKRFLKLIGQTGSADGDLWVKPNIRYLYSVQGVGYISTPFRIDEKCIYINIPLWETQKCELWYKFNIQENVVYDELFEW